MISLWPIIRTMRPMLGYPGQGLMNLILLLWHYCQNLGNLRRLNQKKFIPQAPQCIFILRNNDLGDLLVITPLLAALKHHYPDAKLVVGVGNWNRPTLANNPHVDRILPINAPWHNKGIKPQTLRYRWHYLLNSPEIQSLRQLQPDIGIDVFGSAWGAMLLLRAGIPYRLGVRGYAGGAIAMQACIDYDPHLYVGQSALRFAQLLGATEFPAARPQIFLTAVEQHEAQDRWTAIAPKEHHRLIIGPGSGRDTRYWPLEHYQKLVAKLAIWENLSIVLVGSRGDRAACAQIKQPTVQDWSGQLTLRQTFALVAQADLVICNSSMLMHTAAAFEVESLVLLGAAFVSCDQHDRQWGYLSHYRSLGKEPGKQGEIATVGEAIAQIQILLERDGRS
ncbi:MAG: glycosyltransferase family 9 protein [Spirulina sp. SIO3F2]|nr:glycosyltransferase family 9 protein [Spirulina sp. SIO3F2]